MILPFLLACTESTPPPDAFVRGGVLGEEGRALPDGRHFSPRSWTPGERVQGLEAPQMAECVPLASVPLGDLTAAIAKGISAPDTALAFSPDEARLAVGTRLGEVLVIDAWSGEVLARRSFPEAVVKRLMWSKSGDRIFMAEQSPDAMLWSLDPNSLEPMGSFRMADDLQSSAPPATDDLYGIYTLPGAYGLEQAPGSDVFLLGAHGWNGPEGRLNRSRLWRLRPTAQGFDVVHAWPETPADATFLAMSTDGESVAVSVSKSSKTPAPNLPVGGVAVLDASLTLQRTAVPPGLLPWYEKAFIWEAIGIQGDALTLGLGDGRVWRPDRVRDLGTPVLAGEIPVAATIGTLVQTSESVYTLTSGSSIPFSANKPDLQPPEPHPQEDTVFALSPDDLSTQWVWRGEEALHGLTVSDRWIVVGVGPKPRDSRRDRHGVLVFDRTRSGNGRERLAASCHTGGPVFFRTAVAQDGRIAVVSFPERVGDAVLGSYKVTLFL